MTNLNTACSRTTTKRALHLYLKTISVVVVKSVSARINGQKVVELTNLDCCKIKFSKKKYKKKGVDGFILKNLVNLELAVPIYILIILRRGTRRLLIK